MVDLPSATALLDARSIVSTWDASLTSIEPLAAELVAISIANLSRRKPEGWTERDLLTETTLHKHRFDRDLLRGGPLVERFFDAPRGEMENVLAIAQYIIIHRDEAATNDREP
ncbi:hypothetical protein [Aureimonas pseudogalii]|uniref:Uncharacterized protein n=1 Tax=Aureimonas pseudogalii TaxID=1744844 RepID=A0A7W6MLV1_9HYPH|nr:hypothetical protein [Aureimonas pseudogalii]MBB4000150.1 hypothetical protein [Aureimonas pseudogalii]